MTDDESKEILQLAAKIDNPKEALQLIINIEQVTKDYSGSIDDLSSIVGMIVIGRLFGWRVMRLVSSRRIWSKAITLFGDPKELMEPRGKYARKSVGLALIDKAGDYWEVIKGHQSISSAKRKLARELTD